MTYTDHALRIGTQSRFPISYNGDGWLYWGALFSLIIMSILLIEITIHLVKQLWIDRKRSIGSVFALRITFLLVSIAAMSRIIPDAAYRIAWGEASTETLKLILAIKESLNLFAMGALIAWALIYRYFEPVWTIRLNHYTGQVWGGNRKFLWHACVMTILAAALAGSITFYKAFG